MRRVGGVHSGRLDRLEALVAEQVVWYRQRVRGAYFRQLSFDDRKAEYALNEDRSRPWVITRPDSLRAIMRENGVPPNPRAWAEVLEQADAWVRKTAVE